MYIQEVVNTMNKKKYPVGILVDISKASDRVQFDILLKMLYGLGIRGVAHKSFESYLKKREPLVEVEYFNHNT